MIEEEINIKSKGTVMKCPHCEYQDETYTDEGIIWKEDFFELPITLTRSRWCVRNNEKYEVTLFACPCCEKTFIDRKSSL